MKTKLNRAEAYRAETTRAEANRAEAIRAEATQSPAFKAPAKRIFFLHHLRKIPRDATGGNPILIKLLSLILKICSELINKSFLQKKTYGLLN